MGFAFVLPGFEKHFLGVDDISRVHSFASGEFFQFLILQLAGFPVLFVLQQSLFFHLLGMFRTFVFHGTFLLQFHGFSYKVSLSWIKHTS